MKKKLILGICGKAGAGKDTIADYLVANHRFVKVALADPLKRICREVFNFSDEQLWGPSEMRNAPDKRYLHRMTIWGGSNRPDTPPPEDVYLTPRYALQKLGTEWGRDCYNNVWVDYAMRTASAILGDGEEPRGVLYTQKHGLGAFVPVPEYQPQAVVIPDVRFQNEVEAINAQGGIVWKVTRSNTTLAGDAQQHRSETEQDEIPESLFAGKIFNDDSIESLHNTVEKMITLLK